MLTQASNPSNITTPKLDKSMPVKPSQKGTNARIESDDTIEIACLFFSLDGEDGKPLPFAKRELRSAISGLWYWF
jgi:hypothetical protein